jgi:hypothetical protein
MQETVNNAEWGGDVATLVDWTWTYLYQDIWGLAAFVGNDLSLPVSVTLFCNEHGWDCADPDIHGTSGVQHADMDRGLCGYACSGNPYDGYMSFSPVGWANLHEIGHNLTPDRLGINGSASGEVLNNIFPVHVYLHFNRDKVGDIHGHTLDFPAVYAILQNGRIESDPQAAVRQALWEDAETGKRLVFYWQLAMENRHVSGLGDGGWDLFRLLFLADRIYSNALASDAAWDAAKGSLGFGTYALTDAEENVDGNDFMLIETSYITGRDHREFFAAWGITWSAAADAQMDALALNATVPLEFWVIPDESAFSDPLDSPLPIDGITTWPY